MPVIGILAEADIGNDHQVGEPFLDRAHRFLNDAVLGVGTRSQGVLLVGEPEQDDGWNMHIGGGLHRVDQVIEGLLIVSRHRGDRVADVFALHREEGQDEIAGRQFGFADHAAQGFIPAHAARSVFRE